MEGSRGRQKGPYRTLPSGVAADSRPRHSDAIERCRQAGCAVVQLTSDVRRVDARRFYERLGFEATQVGMTLTL